MVAAQDTKLDPSPKQNSMHMYMQQLLLGDNQALDQQRLTTNKRKRPSGESWEWGEPSQSCVDSPHQRSPVSTTVHFPSTQGGQEPYSGSLPYLQDQGSQFAATLPGKFCLWTKGTNETSRASTHPPGLSDESCSWSSRRPRTRGPGRACSGPPHTHLASLTRAAQAQQSRAQVP